MKIIDVISILINAIQCGDVDINHDTVNIQISKEAVNINLLGDKDKVTVVGKVRILPFSPFEIVKAGAPREDEDGSPCWCNGPWKGDEQHHEFCRERRIAWRQFLETLENVKDTEGGV